MKLIAPGRNALQPGGDETRCDDTADQALQKLGRVLLDGLARAAMLLTPEGVVLDANRAALAMLELSRGQTAGRPLQDLLSDAGRQELNAALQRAAQGHIASCKMELRRLDGDIPKPARELALRALTDDDGQVVCLVAEGHDLSQERAQQRYRENRLRTAEREARRLQELLSAAPAGVAFLFGPDHRWAYVNEGYIRLTGRQTAADFLGKTFAEALPEIEEQGFSEVLDQVYRSGEPFVGRDVKARVNRAASGQPEKGYFDFVYQPMRDAEGKVEGICVYATEVTDKVLARQLVEENSERLRVAQAAAQIGTWEWDPVQGKSTLSLELHRMFDTAPADGERYQKWLTRIHPADRNRVKLLMGEGYRLGTMEMEYRYQHPALGLRWMYCKGVRRPGETRMFGIVQDITARRASEQDAQRLAAIVESSDDAIVGKDLKGIVTSWNAGAERMFGYTAAEMIGQPITTIIPPELQSDETRILATIARGERIEHFETVRLKKSGEPLEISLTISPVRDKSGTIIGAAKIARDITQRKKVEQALRTTERLASVGRLAATVAHEINNPLEAVINLIYLARNAQERDQSLNYLDMAEQELERISHLTKQTLGFYRETKGATGVRVGALVDSLLSIFVPRMRNRSVRLTTEIVDDVEIRAIPGEIRQVVANLLSNSIDALDSGGEIRVRVSAGMQWSDTPRRGVRLTVADNGGGIPADIRTQLFEPFFTTKKDVGTGLGLWICKSIVENHQGSIQVRSSTTPGQSGTVFSVFLPEAAQQALAPTPLTT